MVLVVCCAAGSSARAQYVWDQQAEIAPPVTGYGWFGVSLDLQGDLLVVGQPGVDRAHIYLRDGARWRWIVDLSTLIALPSDSRFGHDVALDGDVAIVGAPQERDELGSLTGAVHVFRRQPDGSWLHEARLVASAARDGAEFGQSVAAKGGRFAATLREQVGEGVRPVLGRFHHESGGWVESPALRPEPWDPAFLLNTATNNDLAMTSGEIVWGIYTLAYPTLPRGFTFVIDVEATDWSGASEIVSTYSAHLGTAVAIAPPHLVTTNVESFHLGPGDSGVVMPFRRDLAGDWVELPILRATWPVNRTQPRFGLAAALEGDLLAASATGALAGGVVRLYRYVDDAWTFEVDLEPRPIEDQPTFGWSLALSEGRLAVGAWAGTATTGGPSAGVVRVFVRALDLGQACVQGSDCARGHCVDSVCCNEPCGDGSLDDCMVCSRDRGAAVDGTCAPAPPASAITCRPSEGECDPAELCDGVALTCPADARGPAGSECRAASGLCDAPELCDGTATACPTEAVVMCDAGAPDAGPMDAGSVDAGAVDGGGILADGSLGDGGRIDAGPRDAGGRDAADDASVSDGARSDAGPVGEVVTYGCGCRAGGQRPRRPDLLFAFSIVVLAASFRRARSR